MSARRWVLPVLVGSVTTGLGVAINLATELKANPWAWGAVAVLTAAGVLVGAGSERLTRVRQADGAAPIINRGTIVHVDGAKNRVKVNIVGPGALVAVSLVVIVAVTAGLLMGKATATTDALPAAEADTRPFDVTVFDEPVDDISYGSAAGYLFPAGTVPAMPAPDLPRSCAMWSAWALDQGGVRVAQTSVTFTVAAVGDDAVRVLSARLHADQIDKVAAGDQITCAEGGPIPVSYLEIDLDRANMTYMYPDAGSLSGASRPFALQIRPGEAEHVAVDAVTMECYCSWYLELLVEANGVTYPYRVDDDGTPFITAPMRGNYTKYQFDADTSRWVPGFN